MSLINRYGPCWGLTLFRWGQRRAEIWFCPVGYKIIEHRHPAEDVELMFIFGKTKFSRRDMMTHKVESLVTSWKYFLRRFTVMHYHYHWFEVGNWPLVFINFQKFFPGITPASAAIDFITPPMPNIHIYAEHKTSKSST